MIVHGCRCKKSFLLLDSSIPLPSLMDHLYFFFFELHLNVWFLFIIIKVKIQSHSEFAFHLSLFFFHSDKSFGKGVGLGVMYMMLAGNAEITKLNSAMNETIKTVQELNAEISRRQSSHNVNASVAEKRS